MEWLFCPLSGPLQEFGNDKIRPWTTTHGFFLQMGGFVLCKDGVPIQAMSFSKSWIDENKEMHEYASNHKDEASVALGIKERILAGDIDAPRITAVEIKDRSKGDALSKFLVISQTTWFTIQCIARWAARLPVTEFEIITLAYAVLNGITYALWWNKPQNVGVRRAGVSGDEAATIRFSYRKTSRQDKNSNRHRHENYCNRGEFLSGPRQAFREDG